MSMCQRMLNPYYRGKTLKQLNACHTPKSKESQTTDTQQLQAKIAALADELELINRDDFYNGKHVTIAGRMRQLSAVQ